MPGSSPFVVRRRAALGREERRARTETLLTELTAAVAVGDDGRRAELVDELVVVNRGVAEAVAARYHGRGIASDDLDQVAYEGLVKAVQRFDPTLGHDLMSFAVPTIRGELRRHFRDHGWTVRPPRRIQELQRHISDTVELLGHQLAREPEPAEVAAHLGVDTLTLEESIAAFGLFSPESLDRPAADGPQSVGDRMVDDSADEALGAADTRLLLSPLLRELAERDQHILYLRFVRDYTQREIGEVLGITQMQVSRLLTRILGDLREQIA